MAEESMHATIGTIFGNFARSLGWVALFGGWTIFFNQIADIAVVDFIHANPNRSQSNAIAIPFLFTPVFLILFTIGLALSCCASQLLQIFLASQLLQGQNRRSLYWVFASVPLTATVTWYSYDYLIPSDVGFGFNEPADWTPYKHGLTMDWYFQAFAFQLILTAFCLQRLKFELQTRARATKRLLQGLFAAGLIIGLGSGLRTGMAGMPHTPATEAKPPSETLQFKPISEWKSDSFRGHGQWTADGSLFLSQSGYSPLAILDHKGRLQTTKILPVPFTAHWMLDPDHVLLMGSLNTDSLFDVYDLATGQKIFQQIQPDAAQSKGQATVRFAISQDGKQLAVVFHGAIPGATIYLFDTATWKKLNSLQLPEATSNVSVMTFSPSGKHLAIQTGTAVFVVDAQTGVIMRTINVSAFWLAISHDEHKLALVSSLSKPDAIKVFDISTGSPIASYSMEENCGSEDGCGTISSPLWTADDQELIFSGPAQTLHIWKPFDPRHMDMAISSPLISSELALSPDGSKLAISTGYMVNFYDMTKLE